MKNQAMARVMLALVAGALFGFGLSLSGMVDPARVSGFLDLASGHWDPSLMFVLGGAISVAVPGVLLSRFIGRPVLADDFSLPAKTRIDRPLILGSAIFGIGWGLPVFVPARHCRLLLLGFCRSFFSSAP